MRYLDQVRAFEKQAAAHRDQVKGGLADQKQPKELPQDQLRMGKKVEREHTKNPAMAKEIAMDHLVEDRRYYTKLRKMEKKAGRDTITVSAQVDPHEVKPFVELLKGLRIANSGHSFSVWVDPNSKVTRYAREESGLAPIDWAASKHFFDGDGSFYIGDITMAGVKVASSSCKKCGRAHRPKCDRCGATTDLRSWHGPCGKCAFGGKEKKAMLEAFVDELEKISAEVKIDENVLRSEMAQLAGEASLAWTPQPSSQIFDSEAALRAVEGTLLRLKTKTARKLTTTARKKLPAQAFVFPKEKRYPIHDASHARNALARASGKPEEAKVRAAVHHRFPGIGKTAGWLDRKFEAAGRSVASGASKEFKQHARKYLPHAIAAGVALPVAVGAASYLGSKRGVKAAIRQAQQPEQEKTAVSAQWVRGKVLGTGRKTNLPFNLVGRNRLQDFADRVVYGGKNALQKDKRLAAAHTAHRVLSAGKLATITKTAVSMDWVKNKVRGAEGKASAFWNTKGRERLADFHLSNLGASVWGPQAHRERRWRVTDLVKHPKPNIVDKAQMYLPKLAGSKIYSSAFRRSKRDVPEADEAEGHTVHPNLSFVERHPKAVIGGLLATGLGAGTLIYLNRDRAKKLVESLRPKTPPTTAPKGMPSSEMEKVIDKAFGVQHDSEAVVKPGVNALRKHKPHPTATEKPIPIMKSTKSPVTRIDMPVSPSHGQGSLGEKLLKVIKQEGDLGAPAKKLNRAARRELERASKIADLNRRG